MVGTIHNDLLIKMKAYTIVTSHSAYVVTDTESNGAKIDGF